MNAMAMSANTTLVSAVSSRNQVSESHTLKAFHAIAMTQAVVNFIAGVR
jgi:hypothetical protein